MQAFLRTILVATAIALRLNHPVQAIRWKRVDRLAWIPSERRVERGTGLWEIDLRITNPCDIIEDLLQIDQERNTRFNFTKKASQRLTELCNQDYQLEWTPKFNRFKKCHYEYETWGKLARRLYKRFVVWFGIVLITLVVAVSAVTASYVISKTEVSEVEASLDKAKIKLGVLNEQFKIQEEINNKTVEALSRIQKDTDALVALVDELDQFIPELQWTGLKVHHKLMKNIEQITKATKTCHKGKLDIEAIGYLINSDMLENLETELTELTSIETLEHNHIKLLFTHPIINNKTSAYRVYSFQTYYNSTGDEKILEYIGPKELIHTPTLNCTKAISTTSGSILEKCEEQNYMDKSLQQFLLKPIPEVALEPQILKTPKYNRIYCMYHNITVDKEDTTCPTDPIELPSLVPFETVGVTHDVTTIFINTTMEVIQPWASHFNETFHEDTKQNTVNYINSIKLLNKQLAEASKYNAKRWIEDFLNEEDNLFYLGLGSIGLLFLIIYLCNKCGKRNTVTVVNTAPTSPIPEYKHYYPSYSSAPVQPTEDQDNASTAQDRQEEGNNSAIEMCPIHSRQVEGGM